MVSDNVFCGGFMFKCIDVLELFVIFDIVLGVVLVLWGMGDGVVILYLVLVFDFVFDWIEFIG